MGSGTCLWWRNRSILGTGKLMSSFISWHKKYINWWGKKLNIEPKPPLDNTIFHGLPMPKNIWDNERSFSEKSYSGQALSSVEDFKNL